MTNALKKNYFFLIALFIVSFLVRSVVFHFYLSENKNYWQVDSNTYNKIAQSIARGDGISVDNKPVFYRLPGYSLFLSVYYKLFGSDTKNVLWMQVFLASFIPILIFILSLVLFPQSLLIAKISAAYSAVHLGLVLYSGFFMTESLFIFFLLFFFILFFSSTHLWFCRTTLTQHKFFNLKKLFFAGVFLGVASLIRPVGHYLIVLAILVILFSRDFFKMKGLKAVALFTGWLLAVLPWLLRNYLLLGQIFFHTLPGGHFLYFSAARVAMHPQRSTYEQARDNLSKEVDSLVKTKERAVGRKLNEIELCDARLKVAIKYFKKYPLITLKNWGTDILRTALSLYSAELVYLDSNRAEFNYFKKSRTVWSMFKKYLIPQTNNKFLRAIIFYEILTFLFILLGCLFGFVRAVICFFKPDQTNSFACAWFKSLPFILLFIVIGLSGGFNRMRLPAEPFLIILSFSFWIAFFKQQLKTVFLGE